LFKKPEVEGHWHSLIEGFSTSSLEFYELVKANITRREIPDLTISQVEWKESGLGSGKRIYLRVSREGMNFDICAAPFGTGYFFSWWLARIPRILLDFGFLLAYVVGGYMLGLFVILILSLGSRGNQGAAGCVGIFLVPFIYLALLLGLGFLVRHGDLGLETTGPLHADHGLHLPLPLPARDVLQRGHRHHVPRDGTGRSDRGRRCGHDLSGAACALRGRAAPALLEAGSDRGFAASEVKCPACGALPST
jgi:hypothetical protein